MRVYSHEMHRLTLEKLYNSPTWLTFVQITMETGASEEFSKMATPLWQPGTLTASRAGVSSSMKKAGPWSGPSTLREI